MADVSPYEPVNQHVPTDRGAHALLRDLLVGILACRMQHDIPAAIMEPLASRLSASSYIFFQFEQLHRSEHFIAGQQYRASDDRLFSEYCDGYFGMDPLLAPFQPWFDSEGMHGGDDLVVSLSDVPGSRDSEFSRRFLRRFGIGDIVGLGMPVLVGTVQKVFCLGFQRTAEASRFTRLDKQSIRQLSPALRCVLENLARKEALALSSSVLDIVSDAAEGGYVLLDGDLLVRDANRRGLTHIGLDPAYPAPVLLGEIREHLLRRESDAWPQDPLQLEIAGGSRGGSRKSIAVRAVQNGTERWWLLLTAEPGSGRQFDAACRTGRLSAREAEVARLIVAGTSNPMIGRVLGIAIHTVENHLRSIYAKCGVSNRTQLATKMLGN